MDQISSVKGIDIQLKHGSIKITHFLYSKLQFLARPLPENVKLLTLEPIPGQEREYILRLEHIYDIDEHLILSSPVEVSLKVKIIIMLIQTS